MIRPFTRYLVVVPALLLLALVGWLGHMTSTAPSVSSSSRNTRPTANAGPVSPLKDLISKSTAGSSRTAETKLFRAFSVLRGTAEEMPVPMRSRVQSALKPAPGTLRWDNTRYVRTGRTGMWLVGGRSLVCGIQAGGGAIGCSPIGDFLKQGLVLGIFEPSKNSAGRAQS